MTGHRFFNRNLHILQHCKFYFYLIVLVRKWAGNMGEEMDYYDMQQRSAAGLWHEL